MHLLNRLPLLTGMSRSRWASIYLSGPESRVRSGSSCRRSRRPRSPRLRRARARSTATVRARSAMAAWSSRSRSSRRVADVTALDLRSSRSCAARARSCARPRAVVLARLAIDALARVAAVIDTLLATPTLERRVRQFGPALPRVFHPLASVKRATLRRTAAFRVRAVRTTKPLLLGFARSRRSAARRSSGARAGCARLPSASRPAWIASVYGSRSSAVSSCANERARATWSSSTGRAAARSQR